MQDNNLVFTLHNTYYIVEPNSNQQGRGSLAINPEINNRSHLLSWQDTSFHPKSIRFKSVKVHPGEERITILTSSDKVLELALLTVKAYKEFINGDAPSAYQETDEGIRGYYQDFINLTIVDLNRGG